MRFSAIEKQRCKTIFIHYFKVGEELFFIVFTYSRKTCSIFPQFLTNKLINCHLAKCQHGRQARLLVDFF